MFGIQVDQELTNAMIEKAIVECADTIFAGDTLRMRQSLLQSHCEHCRCVAQSLARQISEYLGQVDQTVKAVYHYEPVEQPEQEQPGAREPHVGINLVVWVERKSAALSALIEALETALKSSQQKVGCAAASPKCFALDVKLVLDHEVQEERGLGLLVRNASFHSMLVWERDAQPAPAVVGRRQNTRK
jgi:hypothetical protein